MILETEAGRDSTASILEAHGIPFDRSLDLRADEASSKGQSGKGGQAK